MGTMRAWTDAELVAAYGASRDEAAFGEIVSRHGPMIYRVCLGMLGDPHEAEDCSQAVFVVLVRKARSLRKSEDLAAWLYGVARHVSLRAVEARANRAKREEGAAMIRQASQEGSQANDSDLLGLVYRELAGLSTARRQAVILRHLEGLSEEEAIKVAGCPRGTLSCRASEGLARLRERLAKHGQVLAIAPLVGLMGAEAKTAIPGTLLPSILATSKLAAAGAAAGATGGTVFALAEGAIRMMLWAKAKIVAVVTIAAMALAVATPLAVRALKAAEANGAKPESAGPVPAKDETLEFRQLSFDYRYAPYALESEAFLGFACRSEEELNKLPYRYHGANPEAATTWAQSLGIDFEGAELPAEMVLGVATGPVQDVSEMGWDILMQVTKVACVNGTLRIEYDRKDEAGMRGGPGGPRRTGFGWFMIACPRRDLPAVFIENGKEVARVPCARENDRDFVTFLDEVPYATHVAVAEVLGIKAGAGGKRFASLRAVDILYDLHWDAKVGEKGDRYGLKTGDAFETQLSAGVTEPAVGNKVITMLYGASGNATVNWAVQRERTTRRALAPGWWEDGDFRCPGCCAEGPAARGICQGCHSDTVVGTTHLCSKCAAARGICPWCSRRIGPRTPNTVFRLCAAPSDAQQVGASVPVRTSIQAGEEYALWLDVDSRAQAMPELPCLQNKLPDADSFFLVQSQFGRRTVLSVLSCTKTEAAADLQPFRGAARVRVVPCRGSRSDQGFGTVFDAPGTYRVRMSAGRALSNVATLIVEPVATTTAAKNALVGRAAEAFVQARASYDAREWRAVDYHLDRAFEVIRRLDDVEGDRLREKGAAVMRLYGCQERLREAKHAMDRGNLGGAYRILQFAENSCKSIAAMKGEEAEAGRLLLAIKELKDSLEKLGRDSGSKLVRVGARYNIDIAAVVADDHKAVIEFFNRLHAAARGNADAARDPDVADVLATLALDKKLYAAGGLDEKIYADLPKLNRDAGAKVWADRIRRDLIGGTNGRLMELPRLAEQYKEVPPEVFVEARKTLLAEMQKAWDDTGGLPPAERLVRGSACLYLGGRVDGEAFDKLLDQARFQAPAQPMGLAGRSLADWGRLLVLAGQVKGLRMILFDAEAQPAARAANLGEFEYLAGLSDKRSNIELWRMEREPLRKRIEDRMKWLQANEKNLVWDPKSGRFALPGGSGSPSAPDAKPLPNEVF
mgnify:CR=1 FL=1